MSWKKYLRYANLSFNKFKSGTEFNLRKPWQNFKWKRQETDEDESEKHYSLRFYIC